MPSLSANFLDELRARTPIAAVIGRTVRLSRSGREQKGCCPFHGEKTPSFYVYDDHFHCFGCGEHGDVISFVMKSAGAGFMEAVETLAAEAGLEIPKASPQAAEIEQKWSGIAETLEAACAIYQKWLFASEGAAALAYLRGRGLTDATILKFQLGWSGEGRGALAAALSNQGIKSEQLIEAGLMKQGEYGPADFFFNRVMFPIWDRRGKIISFGGRILGDGQPKYVNGPETSAFSKRRSLYGLNFAREAVRSRQPLIVVEGYMDVIALAQAGFTGAVAPLGTALTEEQLADLWQLSDQPFICFDSDRAGRAACLKAANLALSKIEPSKMLAFVRLPDKEDPDSIIRRRGKVAFEGFLQASYSMADTVFDLLGEGINKKTTVGLSQFEEKLREAVSSIRHKVVADQFKRRFRDLIWDVQKKNRLRTKPVAWGSTTGRMKESLGTGVPPIESGMADVDRSRIMMAILLKNPGMYPEVEEAFARVPLDATCDRLRNAISNFAADAKNLDSDGLFNHLSGLALAEEAKIVEAVAANHYRPDPEQSPAETVAAWWSWYLLMDFSIDMLRQHRDEQQRFWEANQQDLDAWARLVKYNELLARARLGEYEAET